MRQYAVLLVAFGDLIFNSPGHIHLVVEDLALASLGLGDEALVKNVEDILADLLKLKLDLLAVLADDANMLLGALGLLLLLDAGDDAPGGTAGADDVLVGDGKKVALVNCELAADLFGVLC
jgi:hypothetical protein